MPPRYAYWTIIVDDQPTAFRSSSQEELMPTFKRLKAKNDSAVMMWFQNGQLWPSRVNAQEHMQMRGERSREAQSERRGPKGDRVERTAWTPRGEPSTPPADRNAENKLDWKPKGEFVAAPKRAERPDWNSRTSRPQDLKTSRSEKPDWKLRSDDRGAARSEKPEWKPKGEFTPAPRRSEKPDWKPKGSFDREAKPDWKSRTSKPSTYVKAPADRQDLKTSRSDDRPRSFKRPDFKPSGDDSRSAKPEWKPKGSFVPAPRRSEKPDWKSKPSSREDFKPDRSDDRPRSFKRPDFKPGGDDSRAAKPEWKPKGSFVPAPRRSEKPDWTAKTSRPQDLRTSRSEKPDWKPKGSFDRERKPAWQPNRGAGGRFSAPDRERAPRTEKLDWKPKGEGFTPSSPQGLKPSGDKRKWVPKEEYKKSMGIEAKRDSKWRPGGEHKDPRQKFKDAKKAKWSKFKKNIRARSGGKGKKSS